MTEVERFKTWAQGAPEGQLMAVGSEESPEPMAMQRVARHLGVSAAALAAASAATLTAPATAAASTAAATLVKNQWPWGVTLVKGLAVGLGVGMSVVAGSAVLRAPSPAADLLGRQYSPAASAALGSARRIPRPRDLASNSAAVALSPPKATNAATASSVATVTKSSPATVRAATRETAALGDDEHSSTAQEPEWLRDGTATDAARLDAARSDAFRAVEIQLRQRQVQATAGASSTTMDPRLAREIASLDLVRAIWQKRDATQALLALREFQRREGYVALERESLLVSIDLLIALGERTKAAAVARRLLQSGVSASERARLDVIIADGGR